MTDTYTYTYDALGRLKQGAMASNKGRETVGYDKVGNILSLVRTGTNSTAVDNLSYSYSAGRLASVADAVATAGTDYQLPGTTAYTYDANGNMKTRTNTGSTGRNITAVAYNHLNLPQSVTAVSGNVSYVYDATGRKLRSTGGIAGQTRDYVDGIEYTGGAMELIAHEEGRITKSGTTYSYQYFLRDHLGNNRVGFAAGVDVTVPNFSTDYYPFGLTYREHIRVGSPKNNYLYNGKELQDGLRLYDYGARLYDPVIARWSTVDPLAEGRPEMTPYHYVSNSPVNRIDPDGRWDNDYRLEKDGRLTLLEKTEDNFDMVYNADNTESIKVAKSEITQDEGSTTLTFKGDLFSAQNLYEFIGKNTDVEYAKIDGYYVDNMIENVSILTTTYEEGRISTIGELTSNLSRDGFVGRNISHIHPSGGQIPSGYYDYKFGYPLSMMPIGSGKPGSGKGDAANARMTQQWPGFRYTKFDLYTPMHGTKTIYDGYNKARIVPVR